MRDHSSSQEESLNAALTGWNTEVRHTKAALLGHINACLQALEQLADLSCQFGDLDVDPPALARLPESPAPINPVRALREMAAHLEQVEAGLARANAELAAAGETGEALARDFGALLAQLLPVPGARPGDPAPRHYPGAPEAGTGQAPGRHLLAQLVEAQRAELAALHEQLAAIEAAAPRGGQGAPASRPPAQVGIHSVRNFVQDSPIADIMANASYYQRILEAANSPEGHRVPMGEILTIAGLITARQLENALGYQKKGRKQPLGRLLVDLGYTGEDAIAQALAAQLSLPYVVLAREYVREGALALVPAPMARRHTCFPLTFNEVTLTVAMANPLDLIALDDLHIIAGLQIRPCVAARREIEQYIIQYYP